MDFYDYTRMSSFKRDKFICCEGLDLNSLDRVKRYLQYFLYGRKLYKLSEILAVDPLRQNS